jgi:hypothetical protein
MKMENNNKKTREDIKTQLNSGNGEIPVDERLEGARGGFSSFCSNGVSSVCNYSTIGAYVL